MQARYDNNSPIGLESGALDANCIPCRKEWFARFARDVQKDAWAERIKWREEVVRICEVCVGTYRNPIPMAEVMRGHR